MESTTSGETTDNSRDCLEVSIGTRMDQNNLVVHGRPPSHATATDLDVIGTTPTQVIELSQDSSNLNPGSRSSAQKSLESDGPSTTVKVQMDDRTIRNSTTITSGSSWNSSFARTLESGSTGQGSAASISKKEPAPDTEFDSALLAGMRDPRERVALLRLENALVDFMKSDSGWLEVGGPYNSVLLSPPCVSKNRQDSPGLVSTMASSSTTSYANEYAPGQRQTTFQKKVLHRLADRFGIVRETGSLLYGSIRLIKLPPSRVPSKLLKDLDPEEYLNNSSLYDTRQQYDSYPTSFRNNGQEIQQLNSTSRSFTNAGLTETKDTPAPPAGSSTVKPRKMKIMKRSDKTKASFGDGTGSENQKKFTRKSSSEISEKEKAYAEARARIFNEESLNGLKISEGDPSTSSPLSSELTTNSSGTGIPNVDSTNSCPSLISKEKEVATATSHSLSIQDNNAFASLQQSTPTETMVSGGATAGASTQVETKAVYRNRAEEAADPDFRRHRTSAIVVPATMYGMSAVLSNTPLHANASSVPYAIAPNTTQWVQPNSTAYPVIQRQQMTQSAPYYSGVRHQLPSQQQQFVPSQQSYNYRQQSFQPRTYDSIATAAVKPHPNLSSGNFSYQPTSEKQPSTTGTGPSSSKTRSVTLTAAAPAFYPPSVLAAGNSTSRITQSVNLDRGRSDRTTSGPAK